MSDEELRDFFNFDDDDDNGDEMSFDDSGFFDDTPEFPEDDMGPGMDPDEFESVAGEDEGGGISRTFIAIAGLITLGVIVIIVLIVIFALGGEDDLTDNQRTATSIAEYNATQIEGNNRTLTALAVIDEATETAVFNAQQTATADFIQQQTQQAQEAEEEATAAAQEAATQTVVAQQTAAAEAELATAAAQTATQVAIDSVVRIRLRTEDNEALGDVSVRLYRDDGDNVFNPQDRLIGETEGAEAAAGGDNALAYGEVGEGTLNLGETVEWTFTGDAGDAVSISAEAVDTMQMDTFLELFGPQGDRLAGDDDSGDVSNALIQEFELPADGTYTIEVSSIAGQGEYELRLNVAIDVPEGDTTGTDDGDADTGADGASTGYRPNMRPNTGGQALGAGIVLARQGPTPTVELGDTLLDELRSSLEGEVDFGSLEPGTYWLELDRESLPADLQAQLPSGEPLILQIIVPEEGPVGDIEFVLQISTPTPGPTETDTPVPSPTPQVTATQPGLVTVTPTDEAAAEATVEGTVAVVVTVTPAMPDTGFFSDVGEEASDIDGTSGLTVLAIAAIGLVAVIVIARKMRTSN